jgi:transmembrane sensor
VTVTEGIVDVYGETGTTGNGASTSSSAGGSGLLRLSAGNQVVWDEHTGERTVRATEPERAVAWRTGRLEYIDEPLAAVVSDVNRYGSRQIVIWEPGIGRLTYTGTVFTGMLNEWLQALPSEFPVRVITHGNSVTIVSSSEPMQAENPAAGP